MEPLTSRMIVGRGTPESQWQDWLARNPLRAVPAQQLLHGIGRVVIVSPHPDDEVLGTAGIFLHCKNSALQCVLVSVTSGEASHPDSRLWSPKQLARAREQESAKALTLLCPSSSTVHLKIPDGEVRAHQIRLEAQLEHLLQPADAVFCPWRFDGHPDHEATAAACLRVAIGIGCSLFEVPIWAWHWARPGDDTVPWAQAIRIPLSAQQLKLKRQALSCFKSQLSPDSSNGRQAVLPDWATARLLRPYEVVLK